MQSVMLGLKLAMQPLSDSADQSPDESADGSAQWSDHRSVDVHMCRGSFANSGAQQILQLHCRPQRMSALQCAERI